MNKSLKVINSINEMGRSRNDMITLVKSLEETISEHIWKIWAYHNDRPKDINTWLKSLNKHLPKLRTYNVSVGNKGYNLKRDQLIKLLVTTPFEHEGDIDVLVGNWSDEGFPVVYVPNSRIVDLQNLAIKYVDLILSKSGRLAIDSSDNLL